MLEKLKRTVLPLRTRIRRWKARCLDHARRSWERPRHEVAVVAVFKNEAQILREWVLHYQRQGVTLIVLINNNSTDDFAETLSPFIASGLVQLRHDNRRFAQKQIYNDQLPFLKASARWLIVCDLDEFVYARAPFRTISEYLSGLQFEVSSIQIPWKMFGSSGHEEQPSVGVIAGFLYRGRFDAATKLATMKDAGFIYCKTIARVSRLDEIFVHYCRCSWGTNQTSDGNRRPADYLQPVSEDILMHSSLHLNHYAIQSRQFFWHVKMTRGDVYTQANDSVRDETYFRNYDVNDVLDDELKSLTEASS